MIRKISFLVIALALFFTATPKALAAGISASGGGNKFIGETFTVSITASGATFDSLQGTISVSGPVDIVSFSSGDATWLPDKSPSNNNQFVGITSATNSLKVATIKLKGKSAGDGAVTVSGVKLALKGAVVGSDSGKSNFSIQKKPVPPSLVKVTSSSHPDPNQSYEATTISLSWDQAKGVTAFSYLLDQDANTVPPAKATGNETSANYTDKAIGTYYFHIRAQNSDGWGETTNFKLNIKEPDPKINDQLSAPDRIKVEKTANFINNIADGNVSGIKIVGYSIPGYTIYFSSFLPELKIPDGTVLSNIADDNGYFEIVLNFPVGAGTKKFTLQGQKDKTLTPISEPVTFEISQAKGGTIHILSEDDVNAPAPIVADKQVKGINIDIPKFDISNKTLLLEGIALVLIVVSGIAAIVLYFRKRNYF